MPLAQDHRVTRADQARPVLLSDACSPYPLRKGGPIRFNPLNSPDGYSAQDAYVSATEVYQLEFEFKFQFEKEGGKCH